MMDNPRPQCLSVYDYKDIIVRLPKGFQILVKVLWPIKKKKMRLLVTFDSVASAADMILREA